MLGAHFFHHLLTISIEELAVEIFSCLNLHERYVPEVRIYLDSRFLREVSELSCKILYSCTPDKKTLVHVTISKALVRGRNIYPWLSDPVCTCSFLTLVV